VVHRRLRPRCYTLCPYTTLFRSVFDLIGRVDAAALSEIGSYVGALYLVGWSVGGMTFGYLGDRVGRVRAFAGTFLLYSAFTLARSEEHTSELQSRENLVCRLLLE